MEREHHDDVEHERVQDAVVEYVRDGDGTEDDGQDEEVEVVGVEDRQHFSTELTTALN